MADRQEQPPELPEFAADNVIATYPDVEEARAAILALERKGVEGGDISLLGPGAERSAPETNQAQWEADAATTGAVGKRMIGGGAVGSATGAALGAILTVAVPGFGTVAGAGLMAAALGGGLAGGALGAIWGGATGLPVSEAWAHTFDAVKRGETCVAVHSDDSTTIDGAVDVLRSTEPSRLVRFGRDGSPRDIR